MTLRRFSPIAAIVVGWLGTACTNPTVDPESTFTVKGKALNKDGGPLAGAEVRVVRFFHDSAVKFLEATVDDLFTCEATDCGYPALNLEMGVVIITNTAQDGSFEVSVKGKDIAAKGGVTDAMGKVEVSNLVVVVLDPNDPAGKAGVFTWDHLFQQTDKEWGTGDLSLWNSDAQADTSASITQGVVGFTWNKLTAPSNRGRNFYRLEISGQNSSRLIIRCSANDTDPTAGGCADVGGGKLGREVSSWSIFQYYSDSGAFTAYVTGDGVDFRMRSKFVVPAPVQTPPRDPVGLQGVWAVNDTQNQTLLNTRATDGSIQTQEDITIPNARGIYVKLTTGSLTPVVSDAGILNAVVNDAWDTCATLEFNTNNWSELSQAQGDTSGWVKKGKFCGGNGADTALSALINFQPSQSAGWLRMTLAADAGNSSPFFQKVGEVSVFSPQ